MWQIDIKRQRGMGKWGWLFTVVFLISAGAGALRLGPHYVDFEMVKGVLDRLPVNTAHTEMSRQEIREHFEKQFRVENFQQSAKDVLKITRDREQTLVQIHYEIREPLAYNADVLLTFAEERTFK